MVEHMITYLYSLKYPQGNRVLTNMAANLLFDAKMYAMADKYDLSSLKLQVKRAFAMPLDSDVQAALEYHLDTNWETGYKSSSELIADLARIVYTNTPDSDRGLRDVIKKYTWIHKKMLADRELQKCILETEGYTADVIQSLFEDATLNTFTSPPQKKPRGADRW